MREWTRANKDCGRGLFECGRAQRPRRRRQRGWWPALWILQRNPAAEWRRGCWRQQRRLRWSEIHAGFLNGWRASRINSLAVTGSGFLPGIHAVDPAEKTQKIPLLAPDETDDIAQAQLVSFHAGVSLDAPFEIFAAPGAEAMAAGGIPDESQRRKQSSESFRPLREPGAGRRWLAMALG